MTTETTEFTIGTTARCSDGACGELLRVVVDPIAEAVTHLVIAPRHRHSQGHLVPVHLAEQHATEIELGCTIAEFDRLDEAEETEFLPGASGIGGYRQDQVLSWPYYGLELEGLGMGNMGTMAPRSAPLVMTHDQVPDGEVQVRRGQRVHATDGDIGRVHGLVVNRGDNTITHVLLDEGHLWGEKRVAIPIGAVADIKDGVRLSLTKDQVRDLPAVRLDRQA